MFVKNKNTDEIYIHDNDEKTIEMLKNTMKPKLNTRASIWLIGVLFISVGVGIADYRAGLIVSGLLLLLTVMVSD